MKIPFENAWKKHETGMDLNIFRPGANRAPNFSNLGARLKC